MRRSEALEAVAKAARDFIRNGGIGFTRIEIAIKALDAAEPDEVRAIYCERLSECRWPGFILHDGIGWDKYTQEWFDYHAKECGGKLHPLIAVES